MSRHPDLHTAATCLRLHVRSGKFPFDIRPLPGSSEPKRIIVLAPSTDWKPEKWDPIRAGLPALSLALGAEEHGLFKGAPPGRLLVGNVDCYAAVVPTEITIADIIGAIERTIECVIWGERWEMGAPKACHKGCAYLTIGEGRKKDLSRLVGLPTTLTHDIVGHVPELTRRQTFWFVPAGSNAAAGKAAVPGMGHPSCVGEDPEGPC